MKITTQAVGHKADEKTTNKKPAIIKYSDKTTLINLDDQMELDADLYAPIKF